MIVAAITIVLFIILVAGAANVFARSRYHVEALVDNGVFMYTIRAHNPQEAESTVQGWHPDAIVAAFDQEVSK